MDKLTQSELKKKQKTFLSLHKCRCCKEDFYPTIPGKTFLCVKCYAMEDKERRKIINSRSVLKREGRIIIHQNETISEQLNHKLDSMRFISDTPLASADRSIPSSFIRYYTQRPFHFTSLYGVEATTNNIKDTSKTLFRMVVC
ncbi:MAG: hypothetical protein ABIC57_00580 [bacterium]